MTPNFLPNVDFDFDQVFVTEFGVGVDGGRQSFFVVPVDPGVQNALQEMIKETLKSLSRNEDGENQVQPRSYNPAEHYGSEEYIVLSLNDKYAAFVRQVHQAENLPNNTRILDRPGDIFCYYARLRDRKGKRLTAIRRATQFKGILKARLVRLVTDSLTLVKDKIFKLDSDFDLVIDGSQVHILRPSSFEFLAKTKEAILEAVPENITAIQAEIQFVDWRSIENYARKRPRAARYLASIKAQGGMKNISKKLLFQLCQKTNVAIKEQGEFLIVEQGYEMDFLEILDRRRYEIELVPDHPERYRAASRRRLDE